MYCFGKYSFGAIFVLLFVFGFGLAGCGDSDSGPTGTPSSVISSSGMSEENLSSDAKDAASSSSKEADSSSRDESGKQASSSSREKKIELSSSSSESAPAGNDSKALFGDDYFTKDGVDFVKIGNQSWMEKNVKITSGIDKGFLRCYDDNDKMCDKYGTMTQWEAFTDTWSWFRGYDGPLLLNNPVQGACPNGTHLPTKAELEELIAYLEGHPDEMVKLTNHYRIYGKPLYSSPQSQYGEVGSNL